MRGNKQSFDTEWRVVSASSMFVTNAPVSTHVLYCSTFLLYALQKKNKSNYSFYLSSPDIMS